MAARDHGLTLVSSRGPWLKESEDGWRNPQGWNITGAPLYCETEIVDGWIAVHGGPSGYLCGCTSAAVPHNISWLDGSMRDQAVLRLAIP